MVHALKSVVENWLLYVLLDIRENTLYTVFSCRRYAQATLQETHHLQKEDMTTVQLIGEDAGGCKSEIILHLLYLNPGLHY